MHNHHKFGVFKCMAVVHYIGGYKSCLGNGGAYIYHFWTFHPLQISTYCEDLLHGSQVVVTGSLPLQGRFWTFISITLIDLKI